ncbi:aromatic amino acid transport family protein [Francisella philomiragia]|uniref:aromatic amino acid transport family protein n=1 Tax=Francisella philomiragia TaxID=28110 RepID=UPI001C9DE1FF|nr:aromatic amino acid transport family protein [Francisella philomiragia]MBY7734614.1 serine permease [Francisella philomiragia]
MSILYSKNFDSFDWGWLVISFGMALGAGIVLVPVTVGVSGIFIYLISALFAYPAIFLFQKLYMNTLFDTKESKCYSETIKDLLGEKWSIVLGFLYFIMMSIWTIVYAETVANALSDYLYHFNIINIRLDNSTIYSLILMIILVAIGTKSKNLLFKASTLLTLILLCSVIVAAIYVIPEWNFSQLNIHPKGWEAVPKTIIMIPFSLTTILFIQSLSPMVMGYREQYSKDNDLAKYKAQRTMKIAFFTLLIIVSFYVLSLALIIPQDQAILAKNHNQSVFSVLLKIYSHNTFLQILGVIINICAILAAFLSILTGMRESLRGVLLNITKKFFDKNKFSSNQIEATIIILIILLTWLSIIFKIPIFYLVPWCGPIFGIIGCLIPAYIVFKVDRFAKYKTISVYYIVLVGIILCISPLLSAYL